MSKIDKAVEWAVSIANDSTHGYDQAHRWGPDYDCSSLIIQAWQNAGVPVKTSGATNTRNMVSHFLNNGFEDVTSLVNIKTGEGLRKGDVVWVNGHVEMMCNLTQLVGAHISETGGVIAGQEGDQTGHEIDVGAYYNKPWSKVLRYTAEWDDVEDEGFISANRYLTMVEMQINAKYIYKKLHNLGWSLNAISGMLGNMQRESTINPGIWQNLNEGNRDGGFGLVQWTPASKLIDWAELNNWDEAHIEVQCMKIHYEMTDNIQYIPTDTYPMSFREFSVSTAEPEYLASVFLHNYERAGVSAESERKANARYWYDYLKDLKPGWEPPDPEPEKKGMSLLMMYLATKR